MQEKNKKNIMHAIKRLGLRTSKLRFDIHGALLLNFYCSKNLLQ